MRMTVLLALLLAGCASLESGWTKPGSTKQQFKADDSFCEAQGYERANVINIMHYSVVYAACMGDKGWTAVAPPKEEEEPKHEAKKEAKHESKGEAKH